MSWDIAIRTSVGDSRQSFDLDVAVRSDAQRVVLFGPSGAGKSLTLRAIAGLLAVEAGHVRIAGRTLLDSAAGVDVPAEQRKLGYVFQEYALFPHLTVRQNVAFGLRAGWRNPAKKAPHDVVDHWLCAFSLEPVAGQYPDQLSGGQRQRTALARALVTEPRALLLDEPFAALDSGLRERLRGELRELHERVGVPMLLISHDEADVAAFGDVVVVLEAGRVVA
ncbi:MAG: ATP-binding cassette domain-containing protein [Caldimonas sp.]